MEAVSTVDNGSSLFTADAGSGESNARRFLIENDLVEAIIALPGNMFYNTTQETYIWILSNRKPESRKGKIQLIDATGLKTSLRRNMGKKNCEISKAQQRVIIDWLINMVENEYSRILPNEEFGYWKITVLHPLKNEDGTIVKDKKGKKQPNKLLTETEIVPFSYSGGIAGFLEQEVLRYTPDAWVQETATRVGYDLSFEKYFHRFAPDRSNNEILSELSVLQAETEKLIAEILGGVVYDN